MPSHCPICQSSDIQDFFQASAMPVSIGVLWPTAHEARRSARGDLHLSYCRECGFIWNRAFDAAKLEYSQRYDNSLDFSPVFQDYARGLAARLIETYGIRGRDVVELGCGKGHFLSLMCELGQNRGVGFDPSYEGERVSGAAAERITYIQDFYGEKYTGHPGDLICCRHVFEHIADPVGFLGTVRRTIGDRREAVVYFEVPNVRFILEKLSVWDIIYEHCNYFSLESLESVFRQEGFEVLHAAEAYGGQFLGIEARLAQPGSTAPARPDLSALARAAETFGENMRSRSAEWQARLATYAKAGRSVVIWGGGAKAVTFLNLLQIDEQIRHVVDINPHKQGRYMPGTGQLIVAPDFLAGHKPDVVILMNPIYRSEVDVQLRGMGIEAELVGA